MFDIPMEPTTAIGANAADERPHLDAGDAGEELWENHGWCVRVASDDGHEFLLWLAFYILRGRPGGRFAVGDVRVAQTVVIHGEFPTMGSESATDAPALADTPFSASGVHWSEYLPPDGLGVEQTDDMVTWSMAGGVHESSPPNWRVAGLCGGITVDLEFRAVSPVSWFDGFQLLNGYEVLAATAGTIKTPDGISYQVNGIGQHEKVHTTHPIQRSDHAGFATLPEERRHMWHAGGDSRLAFSMLANQPGEDASRLNGQVVVDGRQLHFMRKDVTFVETSSWADPRSGVTVPGGWDIEVTLPAGTLRLTVTAYARAYYLWDYVRGSTSLLYWFLADAEVIWSGPGTDTIHRRIPYAAHTNRPFLYWGQEAS
jgi:hypothetical protein